jgi:tyrosyl-tRNA synthetase
MGIAEPVKLDTKDKLEEVTASKMSKSKPWTAIFIHDTEDQIKEKLKKAWCPEKQTEMNPILEIVKHIVFHENKIFRIERDTKFGGTVEFESYEELEEKYGRGEIHPKDLKENVSREISKIIEPIRKHFEKPSERKLLDVFRETEITR